MNGDVNKRIRGVLRQVLRSRQLSHAKVLAAELMRELEEWDRRMPDGDDVRRGAENFSVVVN